MAAADERNEARLAAAAKKKADAASATIASAAADAQAAEDKYYTKVLASGKTQAQIDALRNAYDTAAQIREGVTSLSPVTGSTVDKTTGKVTTTYKDPNMIQMLDGILYKGGVPFTGDQGDTRYVNGQPTETYDRKAGKWVPYTGGPGPTGTPSPSGGGTTYTAPDGRIFTDLAQYNAYIEQTKQEEKRRQGQSAYDLLFSEFDRYGMGALVEPLKQFIQDGISPAEFTLRLRETDAYKKRFAANAQRIGKGLRALSEAEYITMEDQYQNVMRQYGLPETYYTRGEMGRQEGFEKFIAGDVSAVELEDRISTAQKRVLNANPEVTAALKQFYPDITNADILAYTLDPKNAIENIKRKVTAAEIGGAAIQSGLQTGMARAEELGAAGITKAQAQQGFGTIAGGLQRGSQLASIYGEDPYTQTTAEKEVFGLAGKTEAEKQRKKLTGLEKATFSGQTGLTSGALARDRAGAY
jgi:hypothetical protein